MNTKYFCIKEEEIKILEDILNGSKAHKIFIDILNGGTTYQELISSTRDIMQTIRDYKRDYGRIYDSINWDDPEDVNKAELIFIQKKKRIESFIHEQTVKHGVINNYIRKIRHRKFPELIEDGSISD